MSSKGYSVALIDRFELKPLLNPQKQISKSRY